MGRFYKAPMGTDVDIAPSLSLFSSHHEDIASPRHSSFFPSFSVIPTFRCRITTSVPTLLPAAISPFHIHLVSSISTKHTSQIYHFFTTFLVNRQNFFRDFFISFKYQNLYLTLSGLEASLLSEWWLMPSTRILMIHLAQHYLFTATSILISLCFIHHLYM